MSDDLQSRVSVILADDAEAILLEIQRALEPEFEVVLARNGREVLQRVQEHGNINVIVMGLSMPELDGFETTAALKADYHACNIPIILITRKAGLSHMLNAVEVGADDYVLKPLDPDVLRARILLNLKRAARDQSTNPLTGLPGNHSIEIYLSQNQEGGTAVLYCDLDNFKAYNDKYGFDRGDDVLAKTGEILASAVKQCTTKAGFVGHIGGDDFIVITSPEDCEPVAADICAQFDKVIIDYYDKADRKAGQILSKDRQGNERHFPLMSITVAVVLPPVSQVITMLELAERAAELKKFAKSKPDGKQESNYVCERRG